MRKIFTLLPLTAALLLTGFACRFALEIAVDDLSAGKIGDRGQ